MSSKRFFVLAALLAGGLPSTSARAATAYTNDNLPAASACQGALPQFAGTLRARPLAIANEGATTAFVTCGANGADLWRSVAAYGLRVTNRGSATQTASCTGVEGFSGSGTASTYATLSFTLAPGGSAAKYFHPADFGEDTLSFVKFNCSLPPEMEISGVFVSAATTVEP